MHSHHCHKRVECCHETIQVYLSYIATQVSWLFSRSDIRLWGCIYIQERIIREQQHSKGWSRRV